MTDSKNNILIIFSISIMAITGIVAVTPALPYIASDLSVSKEKIGLIVSLFALPGIILTPVYGILADRYGRKKVLIPSLLVFGIFGTAGFFVSDFNTLLILRFISGMGAASLGALNVALIGDLFSGEQRLKVVGYNNSALNLGTTIIPVLGGFLARIHWNYVFLLPSAAVLLALWLLFSFKEPVINVSGSKKYFRDYIQAIKDRRIFIIFLVSILTYIILFGSLWTYIPFLIEKKFLSSSVINGFVIAGMSLTASVTSVFFSRISGKYNQGKLFIFIFIIKLIALVSIVYMPEWYYLFIPMLLFGIGFGINLPNIQSLIIKYSPENQRAAIVSLNRTLSLLGQFLGPVITGFIFTFFSDGFYSLNFIFYFYGAVCILTLLISQLAFKKSS